MTGFPFAHRTLAEVIETEALRELSRGRRLTAAEWRRLEELTTWARANNPGCQETGSERA